MQLGLEVFTIFMLVVEEWLSQFTCFMQDDIIMPVRRALDYYTEMQKALEEEKKRKEAENDKKSTKNGLKSPTEAKNINSSGSKPRTTGKAR